METHIHYNQRINKPYIYSLPAVPSEKYSQQPKDTAEILRETEKCPFPDIRQLIIFYRMQNLDEGPLDHTKPQMNNTKLMYGSLLNNKMSDSPLRHTKVDKSGRKFHEIEQNLSVIDIHRNYSDILRDQYSISMKMHSLDDQILALSEKFQVAQMKIKLLLKCTEKYNQYYKAARENLRNQLQRQLKKPQNIRKKRQDYVKNLLIDLKKEYKNGFPKDQQKEKIDKEKKKENDLKKYKAEKKKIINKQTKQTLDEYKKNFQSFSSTNNSFLTNQNHYLVYEAYSQQFERAIYTATLSQTTYFQVHKQDKFEETQLNSINLASTLKSVLKHIQYSSQLLTQYLFQHREQSKFQDNLQVNTILKETSGDFESLQQREPYSSHFVPGGHEKDSQIKNLKEAQEIWKNTIEKELSKIFSELPTISNNLKNDRQKNRSLYEKMISEYPKFLNEFTCVEEFLKIQKKNSRYRQIIDSEKIRLHKHLEKNYGMIVPYNLSDQYRKYILPFTQGAVIDESKLQLKSLFEKELKPLEKGITYINRDYQILYKKVCDENQGQRNRRDNNTAKEIKTWIDFFSFYVNEKKQKSGYDQSEQSSDSDEDEKKQNKNLFMTHLLESCRKLQRLVRS